jgi:hypothetical protein
VLSPRIADPERDADPAPRHRSPYLRLLVAGGIALSGWLLLPHVPHDQTVIFDLGPGAARLAKLEVSWEAEAMDHQGRLLLNFPSPAPARLAQQFRLADGDYEFRLSATQRAATAERTEVTRRIKLEGSTVTLRVEELTQ